MLVLQDETTEDISIMAGVSPNEDSYFETSVFPTGEKPYAVVDATDAFGNDHGRNTGIL